MKPSLLIKIFLGLPVILFADYILMALFGCATCLLGFGNDFYCGPYCLVGKIVLGFSAIAFLVLIFPDIAGIFKTQIHGPTAKE